MSLTFAEIEKIIQEKIEADEALGVHDLQDLANKSDGYNLIQVNALYAVRLQDYAESKKPKPTLIQAKNAVWNLIRKQNLKKGDVIVNFQIDTDVHIIDTYGIDLKEAAINSLIKDDKWIDMPQKNKLVITEEGAKNI